MYSRILISACVFLSNTLWATDDSVSSLSHAFRQQNTTTIWYTDPLKAARDLKKIVKPKGSRIKNLVDVGELLSCLYSEAYPSEDTHNIPSICLYHFTGQGPIKLSYHKKMREDEKQTYIRSLRLMGQYLKENEFLKQKTLCMKALQQKQTEQQRKHIIYSYLIMKLGYMDDWTTFKKDVKQEFTPSHDFLKRMRAIYLAWNVRDESYDSGGFYEKYTITKPVSCETIPVDNYGTTPVDNKDQNHAMAFEAQHILKTLRHVPVIKYRGKKQSYESVIFEGIK